jgi:uncharacterized protein YbjT (DUF2867 family)
VPPSITQQPDRILVVGGTGFIGRHVVDHALSLGWEVTSLSLRAPLESLPPQVHVAVADTADATALRNALHDSKFEYAVNCGGYIDHTLFLAEAGRYLKAR